MKRFVGIHHRIASVPQPKLVHIYVGRKYTDAICGTPWDHSDTDCARHAGCEWCVVCQSLRNTGAVSPPYEIRSRPLLALVP